MRKSAWIARLAGALVASFVGGSAFAADTRFIVSADGQEVLDTKTSLVWRRCTEGMAWDGKECKGKVNKYKFGDAKKLADEAAPASGKPWRVPTKDELSTIVIKQKKKPMTDAEAFPGTPSSLYWAKRPGYDDNLNGWMIDFGSGKGFGGSGAKEAVRLVRDK
ncbi:MAG TPA: DUF1566 domain-containing protein [Ramlibacter sp.]|nr:DUF1566 domain-containing protein [Ramlibacter sp.]